MCMCVYGGAVGGKQIEQGGGYETLCGLRALCSLITIVVISALPVIPLWPAELRWAPHANSLQPGVLSTEP